LLRKQLFSMTPRPNPSFHRTLRDKAAPRR